MNLSASRMEIAESCAFPFREDVPSLDTPSRLGSAGTAFHEGATGNFAPLAALRSADQRAVTEKLAAWEESEWSKFPWLQEVPFAYDPATDTARILKSEGHRDYSDLRPGEVAGTADLVMDDPANDRVLVPDLKSGRGDGVPASEHRQLRILGLAAARHFKRSNAVVYLLDVDADGVRADEHHYDAMDLDAAADWVAGIVARIPNAQPQPGLHCAKCPAAAACPVANVAAQMLAVMGPVGVAITKENRGRLYVFKQAIEKIAEQLGAALAADADANGPVALGNGKQARRIMVSPESIVGRGQMGDEVEAILRRHGLGDAVERTVSWKAIEDGLKAQGLVRKRAAERETKTQQIKEEIAAAHGLRKGEPHATWSIGKAE